MKRKHRYPRVDLSNIRVKFGIALDDAEECAPFRALVFAYTRGMGGQIVNFQAVQPCLVEAATAIFKDGAWRYWAGEGDKAQLLEWARRLK